MLVIGRAFNFGTLKHARVSVKTLAGRWRWSFVAEAVAPFEQVWESLRQPVKQHSPHRPLTPQIQCM
jgi:hypothetical protein